VTRAVVVRYRTRPDAADDNERLIKAVFEELAAVRPGGIRYSAFRVDETTFVHTAVFDSDADLPAFRAFTSGLPGRCAEPPAPTAGRLVGIYPQEAS
jgi:Antibiotic biosynthesis monooxygenase